MPGGEGRIDEILPRRNSFDRPSVANIDQMVIVCSQAIPKTDPYLVDRMTAIAALKGCEVLICINKCDLDPADTLREYYENAGFRTVSVSAETGEGIDELRAAISGKLKTGCTMVGLGAMLVFGQYPTVNIVCTAIIVITTLYSGIEYFCVNRDVFKSAD